MDELSPRPPAPPPGDVYASELLLADGEAWLTLRGELDLDTAGRLEADIRAAELTTRTVVIDLRAVSFIGAIGLRILLEWAGRTRATGLRPALIPGPAARRLLDVTSTGDRFVMRSE